VEQAVYEEMERLQKEPVPAEELQKVKNRPRPTPTAAWPRDLGRHPAHGLRRLGDWTYINTWPTGPTR